MFPVIWQYCSADAKIFAVSFTFPTQKLTKKIDQHEAAHVNKTTKTWRLVRHEFEHVKVIELYLKL